LNEINYKLGVGLVDLVILWIVSKKARKPDSCKLSQDSQSSNPKEIPQSAPTDPDDSHDIERYRQQNTATAATKITPNIIGSSGTNDPKAINLAAANQYSIAEEPRFSHPMDNSLGLPGLEMPASRASSQLNNAGPHRV
jgi:hypothetical protein